MKYDFRCEKCECVQELVQSIKDPLPAKLKCKVKNCGGWAVQVIYAPAVSRVGMSNEPFDVAVGRDAEVRWADIRRRQALRDKVRKESGEQALVMTGRNEFAPIKGAKLGTVTTGPDVPTESGPGSKASKRIVEDLKKKD
jgi:hypothetical protein